MSDTSTTATAKPKKVQVAIRDWINSAGQPLDAGSEKDTTGFRYIHLPTAKRLQPAYNPETDQAPDGSVFECDLTKLPPQALLMLAAFGGQTLAGNVVNTATNGPKGDPNADVIAEITARFADMADNLVWADRTAGVGGVRYDKDKLSQAIATAKGEADPAPYLAKMESKVDQKSGAVVAADTKGAISYGAFALRNAKVKAAYDALTGGGSDIAAL